MLPARCRRARPALDGRQRYYRVATTVKFGALEWRRNMGGEQRAESGSSALTVGFGSAVAMWAVGYAGRLPAVMLPGPLLYAALVACLVTGGLVLGRMTGRGPGHGALAGLVAGAINLLVLGSLLAQGPGGRIGASALLWIPGSILLASGLTAAGALVARGFPRAHGQADWLGAFAGVAAVAVLLLLVIGGVVTSTGAGLAVVDWPNSFGHNMFLYPFSRMTGGIYYEHAHRLFGSLVGLTILTLAVQLQLGRARPAVRRLGWLALAVVVVQGLIGGLRVTGRLTLSTSAEAMRPSLALALIHGVLGQILFSLLVVIALVGSAAWGRAAPPPHGRRDRILGPLLLALLLVQLGLGAAQRHLGTLLVTHIVFGVAIVTPAVLHIGVRSWAESGVRSLHGRLGLGLVAAVALQLLLGLAAFATLRGVEAGDFPAGVDVLFATAHQAFGAVLLALTVAHTSLAFRSPKQPTAVLTHPLG